ncbi:MAG: hypothetical protein ACLFQZ_13870 [Spirochaetaceae bacterium]
MRKPRSLRILSLFALAFPALLLSQEPPEYAVLPDGVTAMRATELIRNGQPIRLFCEPCGDRYVQEIRVVSVSAEEHPEEEDPRWVLRINGAYFPVEEIYLRREREWRNLAHLLGFDPADVPETIYPFLRARPIPPQE